MATTSQIIQDFGNISFRECHFVGRIFLEKLLEHEFFNDRATDEEVSDIQKRVKE
ncbi:unnamed protein product [Paramecium pentaurelia]|uniref:Uncharacterized protein n=1 Tax=Paramecium pentaurelia TaxID=43138 RepID=A0A8S1VQS8_9CILI|nr:unnamed protein product [Paramecium pentaurelia]